MKRLSKNHHKSNAKEKSIAYFSSQKLLQEKNEILAYESSDKDYGLGHIYGSW